MGLRYDYNVWFPVQNQQVAGVTNNEIIIVNDNADECTIKVSIDGGVTHPFILTKCIGVPYISNIEGGIDMQTPFQHFNQQAKKYFGKKFKCHKEKY